MRFPFSHTPSSDRAGSPRPIPAIDADLPERIETATFAVG